MRFFNCWELGFLLDTILKSLEVNLLVSSDWTNISSFIDVNFKISLKMKSVASINLKFFFVFNIFNALVSKSFAIITSRNNLFNSIARFFVTLKLQDIIPPNALTGSHANADL